ncbi:MAG TPA: universal stress protein [Bryobacteraceae bacterium]|nr:universal stress protein [Bryobacteraceae bacterium]
MTNPKPVVVALPLDHQTDELLATALDLGQRLECPFVVVHALGKRRLESEPGTTNRIAKAKQALGLRLQPLWNAGLDVREEVEVGAPAELAINTALRISAQLIITGGGRPATIRRWLVGSAVEAIVHRAVVPVWVVRGERAVRRRPVLCPLNLSSPSKLGLASAVRMARLFKVPLRVMTVLPDNPSGEGPSVEEARRALEEMLAQHAVNGLDVAVDVVTGSPAERIVDAADDAGMLVIGSRGFNPLVPESLDPVTTRALRHSHCSILAVREVHVDLEANEAEIARLADACRVTWQLIEDDRAVEALPFIEPAAQRAPFNATIQEAYAIVLEKVGQKVEARARHELSQMIRARIDRS